MRAAAPGRLTDPAQAAHEAQPGDSMKRTKAKLVAQLVGPTLALDLLIPQKRP